MKGILGHTIHQRESHLQLSIRTLQRHLVFHQNHVFQQIAEFSCLIAGVLPVHATTQVVVEDILTLRTQRAHRLEAPYELTLFVGNILSLRLLAPLFAVSLGQMACTQILIHTRILSLAFGVERHAHHEFVLGDTSLQMSLNGLRTSAIARDRRWVEGCMMRFVGVAHVVRHHIHQIEIGQHVLEVDKLRRTDRRNRQQLVLAQHLAQLLHQQREVIDVVWRRGDACLARRGILPIHIDAIETKLIHNPLTILGKSRACLLGSCHLTEAPSRPASDRQQHLQRWFLLLQSCDHPQTIRILDVDTIKSLVHCAKGIVEMRHHRWVWHIVRTSGDISHHHTLLGLHFRTDLPCGKECNRQQ